MKKIIAILIITHTAFFLNAQTCDTSSLIILETRAWDTDSNISWEINKHFSFYNPSCTSKNTLLLHIVGTYDNPSSTLKFPSLAANNGFNVVSLKYPNSTAAYNACNASSDINCYINFRKEIIEGIDYSPDVAVDSSNCINNRFIKLLQYLATNNPGQNWESFYSGNTINWDKIIVSGHSQGGGHAAVLGITHPLKRILMFAAPNDYSTFYSSPAQWTTLTRIVEDSAYFGFNHLNDDVVNFSEQFLSWNNLGMNAFGDSIYVNNATSPYNNSHQLYTNYDTTGIGGNHSVMILDSKTPVDNSGTPLFEPVWKYMLGITPSTTGISEMSSSDISIFPNPANGLFLIKTHNKSFLKMYNILGEIIHQQNLSKGDNTIHINHYKSGTYIVKLTDNTGNTITKKLILQ